MRKQFSKILCLMLSLVIVFAVMSCKKDNGKSSNVAETESHVESQSETQSESTSTSENENIIELKTLHAGGKVSCINASIKEFINAKTETEVCTILKGLPQDTTLDITFKGVELKWACCGNSIYKIYLADNKELTGATVTEVKTSGLSSRRTYTLYNLVPGRTYYYKIVCTADGKESAVDSFTVDDTGFVRYIKAEGARNVRDIGGWKTTDGKTVKYELLYRGNMLNGKNGGPTLTENGIKVFVLELGIKSEIDLRTANSDDQNGIAYKDFAVGVSQNDCWFLQLTGEKAKTNYLKQPLQLYDRISASSQKSVVKAIFDFLGNEDNYPIYFHCNGGADRTGTLAFLINGLLGVPYEDLCKDFELTSFSSTSQTSACPGRWRDEILSNGGLHFKTAQDVAGGKGSYDLGEMYDVPDSNYVAFGKLYTYMMDNYSNGGQKTLSQAIENYLKSFAGVSDTTIANIKRIMLGD